jgi:2-polyprenyl-6-methoxyphenol hydroxylase-like FAD-dependent oxidoreductase
VANARDAVIIGAGPAGLAAGACLKARGLDVVILEKSDAVAPVAEAVAARRSTRAA